MPRGSKKDPSKKVAAAPTEAAEAAEETGQETASAEIAEPEVQEIMVPDPITLADFRQNLIDLGVTYAENIKERRLVMNGECSQSVAQLTHLYEVLSTTQDNSDTTEKI